MNTLRLPPLSATPRFWLVSLFGLLALLHVFLVWRERELNLFSLAPLTWLAAALLLSEQRLRPAPPIAAGLGGLLIASVLFKCAFLVGPDPYLRLVPLLAVLGIALLGAGWRGVRLCRRALFAVALLVLPSEWLASLLDLTLPAAQATAFLLGHLGLDVTRQGLLIQWPGHWIAIDASCSGARSIVHLLMLTGVYGAVFAPPPLRLGLFALTAVCVGFAVNTLRVASLAMLIDAGNSQAFTYWHLGDGSLLYSALAVLVFGSVCLMWQVREDALEQR